MPRRPDFLIIGAGVVGLTIALELCSRYPDASITLLEKESELAAHGSGRNSGVLHAGFYYTKDSLKARFCRDGNAALTAFCQEHALPMHKCGKLVAAQDELDLERLGTLLARARANGVELERIAAEEAREIEPRIKTHRHALWSPTTSSIDPAALMAKLAEKARDRGISLRLGEPYRGTHRDGICTKRDLYAPGYVINAAGLYADRIARDFGFSEEMRILPFKGLYLYSSKEPENLRTHVYPVPDPKYPFLGVHFTITVDGKAKIGPTAIPAFWRENYSGLQNFSFRECLETVGSEISLLLGSSFDFKRLAVREMRKKMKRVLVDQAGLLLSGVKPEDYTKWGRPGIRAQLVDTRNKTLIMDFCTQGDERSFHVLNAVSPALTASMPFAAYCCDRMEGFWKDR